MRLVHQFSTGQPCARAGIHALRQGCDKVVDCMGEGPIGEMGTPASPSIVDWSFDRGYLGAAGAVMTAIRDVTPSIRPEEFGAVVGPTGCGKSTALTLAAGLDRPSAGIVRVSDKVVDGITKGAGFVFQTDALLPWRSVLANVALGPMFRGVPRKRAQARDSQSLRATTL